MSEFRSDDQNDQARMEYLAEEKPASELTEVMEPGQKVESPTKDLKSRLAALRARQMMEKQEATPPPSIIPPEVEIVPGDMGKPQNVVEAIIEADRQFTQKVEANADVEKASEKILTAEALYSESLAEKSLDRERFKTVFVNTIQQSCAGLTRDELEESIRRDHIMLFDIRTGIQAKLAYRAELLKDESAENRAKALKEDWLFKPNKRVTNDEKKPKSASKKSSAPKREAVDVVIRAKLKAKGLTDEQVAEEMRRMGLEP